MSTNTLSIAANEDTAPPRWRGVLIWGVCMTAWTVVMVAVLVEVPEIQAAESAAWLAYPLLTTLNQALWLYVLLRVFKRYPLGRSQPRSHWALHALAAIVYAFNYGVVDEWATAMLLPPGAADAENFLDHLVDGFKWYPIAAGVALGIEYVRRYRSSAAAGKRLEWDLAEARRRRAEAELRALKAEVNPALFASALASVSSLVRTNPAAAERALADMGDMMRDAVSHADTHEVTLDEEIENLQPFLAVERARFGRTFAVRWDVAHEARLACVPRMLLQLLIESAVKHGMAPARDAKVRVSAMRAGAGRNQLRLEASCAGAQIEPPDVTSRDADAHLAHIQTRLRELYGADISLELETNSENGAVARVTLPWREDSAPFAAPRESVEIAPPAGPRRKWVFPVSMGVWFAAWGAIFTNMAYTKPLKNGSPASLGLSIVEGLMLAMVFGGMLYLAVRITRDKHQSPAWRSHAVAAMWLGIVGGPVRLLVYALFGEPYAPYHHPAKYVTTGIAVAVLYAIIAAIAHAVEYARRFRTSEDRTLGLSSELAGAARRRTDAELRALKAELNPHFLGNALGAVSALVRADPPAAERMLAELGQLFRLAVAQMDTQEVTLGEEIRGLAPFLAVERARFGERLTVTWDVDADAMDARVPHMILQPLVENAVKHGLWPREGPGRIVVTGRRVAGQLELSVRDDGVGLATSAGARLERVGGIGLANARARLEQLYGMTATLALIPATNAGTVARVTLPWR